MMRLEMRDNMDQVLAGMRRISRSKVPTAAAKALTFTAERVQAAEKAEMERVFDRPTRWTLNSVYKRTATPARLFSRVWIKDEFNGKGIPASRYLPPHIDGGNRQHKRFEKALIHYGLMPSDMYAVPGRRAQIDGNGNISRGQILQILSALGAAERTSGYTANRSRRSGRRRNAPDFFVGRPGNGKGPLGIWQRMGSGARPILIFVKRPTYRRRFDFYGVARSVADREFEPLFRRALAREMDRA